MRHAIVLAMLVIAPLVADAKPKGKGKGKRPAKAHIDAAAKAHKSGKFDVALTELEAAYAIDPQPKLLFAIAQVQAKLDNCDGAISNYEKFLARTKDKRKRAVVKQAIGACKTKLAAAQPEPTPPAEDSAVFRDGKKPEGEATTPPPVETAPPPVETPVAPPPEPTPIVDDASPPPVRVEVGARSGKPWYKDVVGDALVVSGVAAGVVSFLIYSDARAALDDAEAAPTLDEYQSLVDRAHDRRTYAIVLAGGSVALIGAGILRYALRDSGESRAIAVTPAQGGGLITWSGGF